MASLGNFPYYLVSNNPKVKTIADFTEKDRIAVPAVGVSVQSRFLQYAAAKQWGDKEFNRLDKYTIAVPHPDATAALVAGGTELSGHFSNPPFQDQELANPNVHVVLNSYDVLGPNSPTVLFATEKFRDENPKTYKAFIAALTEAAEFAQNDKGAAADTYIRVTKAKIDRAALLKIIYNPAVRIQRHAEEYVSTGRVPLPRGCDQKQTGFVEGLFSSRTPVPGKGADRNERPFARPHGQQTERCSPGAAVGRQRQHPQPARQRGGEATLVGTVGGDRPLGRLHVLDRDEVGSPPIVRRTSPAASSASTACPRASMRSHWPRVGPGDARVLVDAA